MDEHDKTQALSAQQTRGGSYGMGMPYTPPEQQQRQQQGGETIPYTRAGVVWRSVLGGVLGLLGLYAVVRIVLIVVGMAIIAANPSADTAWAELWGGLVGTVLIAVLLLFYPVAMLVRLARSRR